MTNWKKHCLTRASSNEIEIPKQKLEELYLNQKLSIAQIAKHLNCSTQPVHRSLKEYKISIRNLSEACTKVPISKKQLKEWYYKGKLSMFKIADRLGCTHSTVVYKFKKFGIEPRGHLGLTKPIRITREDFEAFYCQKHLSLAKIARIYHCSESGLERRFKSYNLKPRGNKNRACKHKKFDFSGDPIEKAYLIGFRLGDLNVKNHVSVIEARCSTTIKAQADLIRKLFSPYTTPHITKAKRGTIEIVCLLNRSFEFLISKKDDVPKWILKNRGLFFSFFAGYTDAEGCFHLHKTKARKVPFGIFEIQTQQKQIIYCLWENMQKYGIIAVPPRVSVKAGFVKSDGYKNNKDMWRIAVARKDSLWSLISYLFPSLKHKNKLKDANKVKDNLILRNQIPYCRPIDLEEIIPL